MTLPVLDMRLPDDSTQNRAELLGDMRGPWPKFLSSIVSFGVLGLRRLSNIQIRSPVEFVRRGYVNWWLLYLMLIMCVPFTTSSVGG